MNIEVKNLVLFNASLDFYKRMHELNIITDDELDVAKKLLLEKYKSVINNLTN